MRVVVLATPHSGTRYVTEVLKAVGLDVHHEKFGPDGGVGFPLCQPSYMAGKDIENLWHLVRHPLLNIRSLAANMHKGFWGSSQCKLVDLHPGPDHVHNAALFYLKWHDLCEGWYPFPRIRLDELEPQWPMLRGLIGVTDDFPKIPRIGHDPEKLALVPKLTYSMLGNYSWEVKKRAHDYGWEE